MLPFNAMRLKAAGAGGGDPYFANVVALLHFDGTNGSTTITDQIGANTWSTDATGAALSTAQALFGSASGLITAGSQYFRQTAAVSALSFGTGDLTWEIAIRPTTVATRNILVMNGNSGADTAAIYCLSTGELIFYANSADRITSAAGVVVANTWLSIAYSRISGTGRLFAGGNLIGSWSDSIDYTRAGGMGVYAGGPSVSLESYYDEMRLTKVGRYSASYTPAASAFPNS